MTWGWEGTIGSLAPAASFCLRRSYSQEVTEKGLGDQCISVLIGFLLFPTFLSLLTLILRWKR